MYHSIPEWVGSGVFLVRLFLFWSGEEKSFFFNFTTTGPCRCRYVTKTREMVVSKAIIIFYLERREAKYQTNTLSIYNLEGYKCKV